MKTKPELNNKLDGKPTKEPKSKNKATKKDAFKSA